MKPISFVHCSDLHLGCQQYNEPQRWQDFGQAFAHIAEYAIDHSVNYLLIGGDLFHQRNINAQTLEQAIVVLKKLKEARIRTVAIEGNHDKAFYLEGQSWMDFLNDEGFIYLLKPEIAEGKLVLSPYNGQRGCVMEDEGLRIIGLGYLGATTRQRLEEVSEDIRPSDSFTIMLLHAAVDKLMGQDMAGVSSKVLEKLEGTVDYLALGHIHSRQELNEYIFNPGAPEAVHIDEARSQRQKGFYHVIINGKEKTVRFIESKRRNIYYIDINLHGLSSPSEVIPKITQELDAQAADIQEKSMIQIMLYGEVDFHSYAIDTTDISNIIKQKYECLVVDIINNTNLPEISDDSSYDRFDRVSIERSVIRKMIEQEKPEYKDAADTIVNLILKVKELSAVDSKPEDIIALLENATEDMILSGNEAAAAGEYRKGVKKG